MIKIKVDPASRRVIINLGKQVCIHQQHIKSQLHVTGHNVVKNVRNIIKTGKRSGRIYTFRGRAHQASAPGEAPANRTGRLAGSSSYNVRDYTQMEVGETADYALFLEEGTVKMAPRPHLVRAVTKETQSLRVGLESLRKF